MSEVAGNLNEMVRTGIENGAVPDEGGETTHTTERTSELEVFGGSNDDIPIELVDCDGTKGLFAVSSACRLDLEEKMGEGEERRAAGVEVHSQFPWG